MSGYAKFLDGTVLDWDSLIKLQNSEEKYRFNSTLITTTEIKACAFHDCVHLIEIEIPMGITKIGDSAFLGCRNLQKVVVPSSVTEIPYCSFYDCYRLKSVSLGDNITAIKTAAFGYCKELKSIIIPSSVQSIGLMAFVHSGLIELEIPNSITEFESDMFVDCYQLKKITLPNSILDIPCRMFQNCKSLETVNMKNSVLHISKGAFDGCVSLKYLHIPDSVDVIDKKTFSNTKDLTISTNKRTRYKGKDAHIIKRTARDCKTFIYDISDSVTDKDIINFKYSKVLLYSGLIFVTTYILFAALAYVVGAQRLFACPLILCLSHPLLIGSAVVMATSYEFNSFNTEYIIEHRQCGGVHSKVQNNNKTTNDTQHASSETNITNQEESKHVDIIFSWEALCDNMNCIITNNDLKNSLLENIQTARRIAEQTNRELPIFYFNQLNNVMTKLIRYEKQYRTNFETEKEKAYIQDTFSFYNELLTQQIAKWQFADLNDIETDIVVIKERANMDGFADSPFAKQQLNV